MYSLYGYMILHGWKIAGRVIVSLFMIKTEIEAIVLLSVLIAWTVKCIVILPGKRVNV